jgi:hypothetical protein
MDQDPERDQRSRENMLTVVLVIVAGGLMLFFLYVISLGIVGNVLAGGVILVIVGALHYLVWGRSFSEQVAEEREALRRREAQEPLSAPPAWQEASEAIQDLTHTRAVKKSDG